MINQRFYFLEFQTQLILDFVDFQFNSKVSLFKQIREIRYNSIVFSSVSKQLIYCLVFNPIFKYKSFIYFVLLNILCISFDGSRQVLVSIIQDLELDSLKNRSCHILDLPDKQILIYVVDWLGLECQMKHFLRTKSVFFFFNNNIIY